MSSNEHFEILVIDDDKVVSLLHRHLLSHHLQSAIPFLDAINALNYLDSKNAKKNHFLLLLDINMPILNGWDFLKELRKKSFLCSIYVVLVTSSICAVDKRMADEFEQVIGFCHKPLQVNHLNKLKELPQLKALLQKHKEAVYQI